MAAPTIVGICNRALQKLGAQKITVLTENAKGARACANCYEEMRDSLLRKHLWNFAVKRSTALPAVSPAPTWGRANEFELPTDFIRLANQYAEDNTLTIDHEIEGQKIVTNDGAPLYIRYVSRVTDPVVMDPLFREALATLMAIEMCEDLTQSNTKKAALKTEFEDAIAEARKANAFERRSQKIPESEWVTTRA